MQVIQSYPSWGMLVVLGGAGAVLLLLIMRINNAQARRAWEHAERMKAMEIGLPVPPRDSSAAKAAVCIAIGAVVPIAAMLIAWFGTAERPHYAEVVWVFSSVLAMTCVGCATGMAGFLFRPGAGAKAERDDARMTAKPAIDPDAFDFAGRRG
jgi:hypothetical protein